MARGRMISKSISTNGQLRSVSLEADFLFGRMIPHLDCEGRISGDPDVVKATACPLRREITVEVVSRCIAELESVGLIECYEVNGQVLIWFPGFVTHQTGLRKDREAASRIPPPPGPTNSGLTPDELPQPRGLSEVKGSEVKGSEAGVGVVDHPTETPPVPAPAARKRGAAVKLSADEQRVWDFYRALHPRSRIDEGQAKRIRDGLASYSADELCSAIQGCHEDAWHSTRGKTDLDYILRNNNNITLFISKHDAANTPLVGTDNEFTDAGRRYFASAGAGA